MSTNRAAAEADLLVHEYQVDRHGRLLSASRPAPGIDAAHFLRQARGQARVYWRDGRRGVAFAGVGVAADLMGWGETRFASIRRQVRELFTHAVVLTTENPLAAPRLCGGFAFREDFAPDIAWAAFNPAHFILPHYQLVCQGNERWLTINTLLPPDERPMATLPMLREALDARYALLSQNAGDAGEGNRHADSTDRAGLHPDHLVTLSPCHPFRDETHAHPPDSGSTDSAIDYPLPYTEWARMIRTAQEHFRATPLQKVVLSRICQVRFSQPVDVDRALAYLDRHYPNCFTFLFEPRPGRAFFGATPELLVRVQGERLETMALAGSIQRGTTPAEDTARARALLHSPKDRHEQALVVHAIRRRLEPLTTGLNAPSEPQVLALSNIQHLCTPIRGTLVHADGVLPLVEELHPTPALGGTPREQALAFIREHEPTLRGWYAAPVGWIDHNLDGAFAVAIRSAVAQERRVWLYAGAGIVADSLPEKEWEETGWKFRPIQNALGIFKT